MSEARQILKIAEMEPKLLKEAGVNFRNDDLSANASCGRRALNATGAAMDSVDILYGDAEAQRRGARGLAGRAHKNGEAVVDAIDVFSDDPRRRAQGATGLAAAAGGRAATMAMNQGTNVACREAGKFALREATSMAVNEGGRRGAIVATGRGAAVAAGARGAAAGAGNIGKVATGATGFAVGAAGVVGQIGGEALGSALGKALGDEQAGKTIGGLGGSMGSAALAGACVGGPIGAAAAAGISGIGYGVGKGVEAVAKVIGRCFEGGYFPTNARQVFGKDWGHSWDSTKKKALEEIAKDPERRVAVTTYFAFVGFHIRIYEAAPGQPMQFVRKDGIHDLLRDETRFLWTALASGRYMQAHHDGSLKHRELFGGDWEAFRIFPVYGLGEERYVIKTCHNTYLMVDEDGNVRQTQACSDISGTYAHTAGSSLVTLTQNGCSGTSSNEGSTSVVWSYTVSGSTATIHGHGVTGQISGSPGSFKIVWTNGITYTQADPEASQATKDAANNTACQFAIIPCAGGIAFRSCSGSYLSARKDGCFNTQHRCGDREQFTWVDLENGYMALRIPDVDDSSRDADFDYEEYQATQAFYEDIAPFMMPPPM